MKYTFIIMIMILSGNLLFSQLPDDIVIKNYEDSIYNLFRLIPSKKQIFEKEELNEEISNLLEKALNLSESFEYKFDSLKHVGKIYSPDNKVRIFTWNLPFNDGTHKYYGFIQVKKDKNEAPILLKLTDKSDSIEFPENAILTPNNWYGTLYYQIILNKYKGTSYYTLLGFDFNDFFSSKKIIDVFYFDEFEKPVFGKQIFEKENKLVNRIIFEFSARASMTLKYNSDKELIVFDHLSPSRPSLTGNFQFYGPDFSYDGFKFEDGTWKMIKDIDVRNILY